MAANICLIRCVVQKVKHLIKYSESGDPSRHVTRSAKLTSFLQSQVGLSLSVFWFKLVIIVIKSHRIQFLKYYERFREYIKKVNGRKREFVIYLPLSVIHTSVIQAFVHIQVSQIRDN